MAHLTPNKICNSCGEYEKDCNCGDLRMQLQQIQNELEATKGSLLFHSNLSEQRHKAALELVSKNQLQAAEIERLNSLNEHLESSHAKMLKQWSDADDEIEQLKKLVSQNHCDTCGYWLNHCTCKESQLREPKPEKENRNLRLAPGDSAFD